MSKGHMAANSVQFGLSVSVHRQAESETPNFQHDQRKNINQLLQFHLIAYLVGTYNSVWPNAVYFT